MSRIKEARETIARTGSDTDAVCFHCGTRCISTGIGMDGKVFCCEGCLLVYQIINSKGLCDYYSIASHPGLSQIKPVRTDKYAWLDDDRIARQLYKFFDGKRAVITFYIPGIHCSSCMWLLEHLPRLDSGITESRMNFSAKELTIRFQLDGTSLRKIVELLVTIGYEPHIDLENGSEKPSRSLNRSRLYKLGVAGFCFGNIMMLSFPEYLSSRGIDHQYTVLFRFLNLALSLPVFFYAASEFFATAWAGLKQRMLNIDAPIALAIVITFGRSLFEILSDTGSGYLDSMSGIVFFMLVGRVVQERAWTSMSFQRDYRSYFPIAVTVITGHSTGTRQISELKKDDLVQLHHEEIIPADAVVVAGDAYIDYSFVTGESAPVKVPAGNPVYAGGRHIGERLTIKIVKPVAGSYLTSLWNHYAFSKNKVIFNRRHSFIQSLSRYFTITLFVLAAITAIYWSVNDPARILPAVSAMLIVACPCALLLSATYTNGNLLRIFSNNGLYLRDASVIEQLGETNHVVFDKTGTLTQMAGGLAANGAELSDLDKDMTYTAAVSSSHPYSKALALLFRPRRKLRVDSWNEITGKGIEAEIEHTKVLIGSAGFVGAPEQGPGNSAVYVSIGGKITGYNPVPGFREYVSEVVGTLQQHYGISVLSGDNKRQQSGLRKLLGEGCRMYFEQKPLDKLLYIESLQQSGGKVVMIGDGLNDAGALQQSNVGITLADDINNFTPSCDAILDASQFRRLPALFKLARSSRGIIYSSFVVSLLYNIIGITLSMQGNMKPMIAAILMPVSTLSIVLVTIGAGSIRAKMLGLSLKANAEKN